MTVEQLIKDIQRQREAKLTERNTHSQALAVLRGQSDPNMADIVSHRAGKDALDLELDVMDARIAELEAEHAQDQAVARAQAQVAGVEFRGSDGETADYAVNGSGQFTARQTAAPAPGNKSGRATAQKFQVRGSQDPAAVVGRFSDHPAVARAIAADRDREQATTVLHGTVGGLIRSLTTSGASAVVPVSWASELIDIARNHSAVLQAGATIVPMATKTVQIGRLTADPTSAFRTEGSTIPASDPTFDNVTLTANSLNCMVVVSNEWLADSGDTDQLVQNAMGKSMALSLDKAALYGGILTGDASGVNLPVPPNPRGVLAALTALRPTSVLGASAANGTVPTNWNEIIDLDFLVENLNESPTGLIWPSRLAQKYAKLYDTLGQPMRKPDAVADFPFYTSNQVATGMTKGTLTTGADAFLADWTELLIGQRMEMTVQVLTERYADVGNTAFVLSWRGDVQPARTSAFAVYRFLAGS